MGAVTFGSTEKPAEMAALEFPGRACFFHVTLLFFPAGCQAVLSAPLIDQQKKDLPLDMGRYGSPSLFIAVDRLKRHS